MAARKRRRRRKKHPFLTFLLLLILAIGIIGTLMGTKFYMAHTDADFPTALRQTLRLGGQYLFNSVSPADQSIPTNPYHSGDYYRRGDFIQCSKSEVSRVGIDVSSHQKEIDWNAVADAGVDFAMVRVGYRGYTEGDIFPDTTAIDNIEGALNAGLDVGAYFYSQATTEEEALEEAQFVLKAVEGYTLKYPIVFDWERVHTDSSRTINVTGDEMTDFAQIFCSEIEKLGYTAGIYFNQSDGYNCFSLRTLRDYDFWLAEYADTQSFAYAVQLWQYDNAASVPGIEGPVDVNLCYKDYEGA